MLAHYFNKMRQSGEKLEVIEIRDSNAVKPSRAVLLVDGLTALERVKAAIAGLFDDEVNDLARLSAELNRIARKIICHDYGQVYYHPGLRSVVVVLGDAHACDDDTDETDVDDIEEWFYNVPEVLDVQFRDEHAPSKTTGYFLVYDPSEERRAAKSAAKKSKTKSRKVKR